MVACFATVLRSDGQYGMKSHRFDSLKVKGGLKVFCAELVFAPSKMKCGNSY